MKDDELPNEGDPQRPDEGAEVGGDDLSAGRPRLSPRSPKQAIQPDTPAPPPPRSRRAKHPLVVTLNFFMMVVVLTVLVVGAGLYFGQASFTAPGPLNETRTVMISPGADLQSIAAVLKRQGIIESDLLFSVAARVNGAASDLKAGEYLFEPGVSMQEVMNSLVSGRSLLHAVTIPEGLTSRQIVDRLLENELLVGDIREMPEEGSLLPETYKFTRGATRQQIIDQMRRARDRIVAEIWERRSPDLPVDSIDEFVTLASIVEKETGKADERPRVAAVFINRLERNMRLQSDPTIIYGLFGGEGKPADRPIFRSDIDNPTPYNTYTISGLPPGPIANPGRAALEAVANPSRTDDLYFVADGSGGHVFAESLDEHNRNVARWRQIEQAQRDAAAASPEPSEQAGEGVEAAESGVVHTPRPRPVREEAEASR